MPASSIRLNAKIPLMLFQGIALLPASGAAAYHHNPEEEL
jgi:hypothetical protein